MFLGLCWGWWSHSIEGMTHSGERVCTTLCTSIFWAVGHSSTSSAASLAISEVGGAVWVLNKALVTVSEVFAVAEAAVVGGDVAVVLGGSRFGTGGVGLSGKAPRSSLTRGGLTASIR